MSLLEILKETAYDFALSFGYQFVKLISEQMK
jgi:hypothetical protein